MDSNVEYTTLEETQKHITPSPKSPRKQQHVAHQQQRVKSSALLKPHSKRHIVTQRSCDETLRPSYYLSNEDDEEDNDECSGFYTVLYDYKAGHDDELTLVKGNCIKVLSKDYQVSGDDGWWTGCCLNNGKRGLFPYNYVEPSSKSADNDNDDKSPRRHHHETSHLSVNTATTNTATAAEFSCVSSFSSLSKPSESGRRQLPPHIPFSELEFKNCIGAGGFGKVFRGYWIHECQSLSDKSKAKKYELVAIKEARVEGDKDDLLTSIKQSVLQEAKLFWMLRHPNIIQLKGVCFQEPKFCLVMEYAKGGSLGRLLGVRKIGFPPYVLIKWALQVSQGNLKLFKHFLKHVLSFEIIIRNE